jgi:hypothetical protein
MATPATQIAAGDLDGDGMDDLLGIWPGQGGVWVKYSSDETWEKLSTTADWIACGKMRSADASSTELALTAPIGGFTQGPGWFEKYEDLSSKGPGGWNFTYDEEENLFPRGQGRLRIMRVPGPGEPGFRCIEQNNLEPWKGLKIERNRKKK